jgi:hypothetical protein
MKNKIFQIGFNKCGSVSLYQLFNLFVTPKIKCIHWDKGNLAKTIRLNILNNQNPLNSYEEYTYFGDLYYKLYKNNKPYRMIKPELNIIHILDQYYPNSKYILNTRNMDTWIKSKSRWNPSGEINFYLEAYKLNSLYELQLFWQKEWEIYYNNVINYFKGSTNRLLIYDIEKNNINDIKKFFPEYIFNTDIFPHYNKTK